jgi:hypothetical protein
MSAGPATVDPWVVVLEFQAASGDQLQPSSVVDLIGDLRAWKAAGLCSTDRYAVQIEVMADTPSDALHRGMQLHARAAGVAGANRCVLVRCEVMTSAEFDGQLADLGPSAPPQPCFEAVLPSNVYSATRAMIEATSAAQLSDILVGFVDSVGGEVRQGMPDPPPGHVSIDISLAGDQRSHAVVESFSVGGLIMEHVLPDLLDDARAVLTRIQQPHPCRQPPR